ncbi:MAG: GatB/YqeY domain-containing protein [Gammaproteobacteria bacterium]
MTTAIKDRLMADIKVAMKAGEKDKLAALRLISAAVKQFEVDHRSVADDAQAIELLTRMSKQRRESIAQFEAAGRDDLVAKEQFELALIADYLPAQLDPAAIETHVIAAIESSGAAGMRDMGKVMAVLNSELKGRADMAAVSSLVKARLSG